MDTSNKVREYTKKLSEIGQEHIFDFYSELSEADQEAFLRQIETIDFSEVKSQIDRLVLANEKDADFHLFVIPYEYQTRKCDEGDLIPQKKIATIFNKNKINFFDLTREFCDNNNPNSLYYKFDPAHLSVNGHKFVFNLINEKQVILLTSGTGSGKTVLVPKYILKYI